MGMRQKTEGEQFKVGDVVQLGITGARLWKVEYVHGDGNLDALHPKCQAPLRAPQPHPLRARPGRREMSARDLQVGDHFTPAGYRSELTVIAITDHTTDSIGHVILEAIDDQDFAWFVWDGAVIRGEHR